MQKKDLLFILFILVIGALLIVEPTREAFVTFTTNYKILGGFLKFAILASAGDLLGARIKARKWVIPTGFIYKMIIWGLIGIVIVLIFTIFSSGVTTLQTQGILPFAGSTLAFAFFVSLIMNLTFAPTMMAFHRITDKVIEDKIDGTYNNIKDTVNSIDWSKFVSFVVLKTIPLFWIPAHTITFLLPAEYQVLFASFLGIALGLLLGLGTKKSS